MNWVILLSQFSLYCFALLQAPLGPSPDKKHKLDDPFDATFDELAAKSLEYFHVPGISIAVVDGDLTYSKGYGYASLPCIPATPRTLYYTASTTKSFTAASILMLVERSANSSDQIKLTTPISSLIDFKLPDEYASTHVTLEDALSHRTGMPRHDFSYGDPDFTLKEVVYSLRNLPLTAEIRQVWQYSNMMFMVLSVVIETITDSWLGDFLRENIWTPLNMSSTFFTLRDAQAAQPSMIARGYFWDNGTQNFIPEPYYETASFTGAGAIISSVLDYAKYLKAIMNEHPMLSKESYSQLRMPRQFTDIIPGGPFTGPVTYTLGWQSAVYRNMEIFFHGGSVEGYGTLMAYMPAKKWAVALMTNADIGGGIADQLLAFELVDRLLGTPENERFDWKQMWDGVVQKRLSDFRNGRKLVYPDAPNPKDALKHSLALKDYTGTYWNPGYRHINLTLINPPAYLRNFIDPDTSKMLHAAMNRTWSYDLDFEHVNGEHFLVRQHPVKNGSIELITESFEGEFRIGSNGKVAEMGIRIESLMKEKIWFTKTA